MILPLALACGVAFGFAFGLTGVGSVFAVPLLVYGIGLDAHRAVCVAMVSVTALSALSSVLRSRAGGIDWRKGFTVAAGGLLGAPLGAWAGHFISGRWLMLIFAFCVVGIAVRLLVPRNAAAGTEAQQSWTRLGIAGFAAGFLAGLLGLGGAIVVPSLVLFGGLEIHRAIATSFPVIFAIGAAAISSHFLGGQSVPPDVTLLFASGGLAGMIAGQRLAKRVPSRRLELIFAIAIQAIAIFILARTFY